MTDEDTQAMSIRLPRDLHEWLRQEAFETRVAMNAIIAEALSEYRASQRRKTDERPRN